MRATSQRSVRALVGARVGVAAAAGLAALVLAGCGGDTGGQGASGQSAPPSSAAPSATASPDTSPGATGSAPPRGRATDPATASRVTLIKSGGFAGVHEEVVVESDGRWTFTTRDGKRQTGRLTDSQAAELRKLSSSTALVDEGRDKPRSGPKCADAFIYTLTVGDTVIRHEHCGAAPPRPTFNAIVKLLSGATPLT